MKNFKELILKYIFSANFLTLIWVGFIFGGFFCSWVGGIGRIPHQKIVRIMLEAWNLVFKYTHMYIVSENIPVSTETPLILLMSVSFAKNQHSLAKIVPLLKAILWQLCYRIFSPVCSFFKIKNYC